MTVKYFNFFSILSKHISFESIIWLKQISVSLLQINTTSAIKTKFLEKYNEHIMSAFFSFYQAQGHVALLWKEELSGSLRD